MKRRLLTAAFCGFFLLIAAAPGNKKTGQSLSRASRISSPTVTDRDATGLLERSAGSHVIGFGTREIIFGTGDHALRLEFVGSRRVSPESSGAGTVRSGSQTPTLGTVIYKDLWPGISLTFNGDRGGVAKSVWTVATGARVESIRIRANAPLQIDKLGNLTYSFPSGRMTESRPVAWQEIDGRRVPVEVAYRSAGEKEFGFTAAAHDPGCALVIDPILSWNTFQGAAGLGDDSTNGIALDSSGNIYVVGYSNATWGSPVRSYTGDYDAFVAKLSPNGSLLWNTFLGGTLMDTGYAIGLDGSGNIYISGYSNAAWGSPVRAFVVAADQFVAKLDSGGALIWNTFLGGTGNDYNNALAVDSSGNSYVTGVSLATWGSPVNPMVASPANYRDWTIAKVSSGGVLQWNTFHGGTGHDYAFGAALDTSGNLYVVGRSATTWGAPLSSFRGGTDVTVVKLNASTGVRQWHTFYGQSGADSAYGVAIDDAGTILIVGTSDATWGAPINPYAGGATDGLVVALDSSGTYMGHTFLGGTDIDGCVAVAADKGGSIYVGGYSTASWGQPDKPFGGGSMDGFLVRLGNTGSLQGHAFIGGSASDAVNGLTLDANRNFYAVGTSDSEWGSPIVGFAGLYDGFVMRSTFMPEALTRHAVGDFDGDTQDEAAVDFGALGVWMYDAGAWIQLSDENPELLASLNIDGDDEILADQGDGGLNLWNSGSVTMLTGSDVEGLAVGDVDADGSDEIIADFGSLGLWLYNGGAWTQLSAVNVDYVAVADLDGAGGKDIIGDFGSTGLWTWQAGTWTQLSGVNADFFAHGNMDGTGADEIAGDFGATGLWLWNAGAWTQPSGVNVNFMITADSNADGMADIIGDFGPVGLWLWSNGSWTMLSGMREEFMISADVDADPIKEVFVDFGPIGLWAYHAGGWYQLSGVNPDYIIAGDFDGDTQAELMVDFGSLGLWLCDNGSWTQVSSVNPD